MELQNSAILFLIDGMRPDGLQQADTPVMDGLIASGAHTFAARTVTPSYTLPCLVSLFLGVPPERHGNTTNTWTPLARPVPGLVDVIQQAGGKTASFYNWEELRDLSRPGSLDASFFLRDDYTLDGGSEDTRLAELAARWLGQHAVNFAFVYLGYADVAGHVQGWMSAEYRQAIANADQCIGLVLEALPRDSLIVVTSDHGGHDQAHGTDSDEDMVIPLVMSGPGIPRGYVINRPTSITDIAPTITTLLGVSSPVEWTGNAIQFR